MAEATVKTPVTMSDGRIVEFTAKQKLSKESQINGDTVVGRFDFKNGETRTFTIPTDLVLRFAAHGMEQKLGDAIAGEPDLDDAIVSFDELLARLSKGEWTATRSTGANTGASVLLKALVEVTGKPVDKLKEYLSGKSQAEKLALRKSSQLAPVIAKIEAEKAKNSKTPAVDTASLFGELDSIGGEAEAPAKAAK